MFKYRRLFFLLIFSIFPKVGFSTLHCYFTPPKDWKLADPKTLSKRTIIGYIDTKKSGLYPSINLTTEKIQISFHEYLDVVRKNCLEKKQVWKSLGMIETGSGKAALASIEVSTKFGTARLLQAVLMREERVFILTTCSLKKDFVKHMDIFKEVIHSMTITENLFFAIKDENKQKAFLNAWQKKKNNIDSEEFERIVLKEGASLGSCWQILMLRQGISNE